VLLLRQISVGCVVMRRWPGAVVKLQWVGFSRTQCHFGSKVGALNSSSYAVIASCVAVAGMALMGEVPFAPSTAVTSSRPIWSGCRLLRFGPG
jgi:hypothetical protein